jgi:hypothetical protein
LAATTLKLEVEINLMRLPKASRKNAERKEGKNWGLG